MSGTDRRKDDGEIRVGRRARKAVTGRLAPVPAQPFHGYVSVQSRGLVALPTALRSRYRLDEPGAQVEITEREDGVLELRPTIAVPASEAWFWDERWQEGEREAEADIAAGRVQTFNDVDDFVAHLDRLSRE